MHHRQALPLLLLATLAGCSGGGRGGIPGGIPITHVQRDYGFPDVISDASGDQERFYVPSHRPKEEWPWDAPRTFYYLQRGLAVTFVRGQAIRTETIDPELRERVLRPLVQQHAGGE